jgi:GGDEF domain-containing protein
VPVEFEGPRDAVRRQGLPPEHRPRHPPPARSQARIDFLAHHDLLTGLPNRALLNDRLDSSIARARGAASTRRCSSSTSTTSSVSTIRSATRRRRAASRSIAERIPKLLRSVDVVSRHGGDEFLVVLPDLESARGPIPVAEKLLAAISEPMELEGRASR